MNEVQTVTDTMPAPPQSESAAIMALISRTASDPTADVDKLERMMALYERVQQQKHEREFNIAMMRAQSAMGTIGKDATNPQTRSKYATFEKLDRAIRPIYTREGFALSFDTAPTDDPLELMVMCYVTHQSGHSRTYRIPMPRDGKGAKDGAVMSKTHATGAATSYGARYLLKLIFNIAVGESDDDGNLDPTLELVAGWTKQIEACETVDALNELGDKIKAAKLPQKVETVLRSAFVSRLRVLSQPKEAA